MFGQQRIEMTAYPPGGAVMQPVFNFMNRDYLCSSVQSSSVQKQSLTVMCPLHGSRRHREKIFGGLSISPIFIRRVFRAGNASPAQQGDKSMRFMMIYKPADTTKMEAGVPPSQQEMARMGQ